jgi:hypothetical protein
MDLETPDSMQPGVPDQPSNAHLLEIKDEPNAIVCYFECQSYRNRQSDGVDTNLACSGLRGKLPHDMDSVHRNGHES